MYYILLPIVSGSFFAVNLNNELIERDRSSFNIELIMYGDHSAYERKYLLVPTNKDRTIVFVLIEIYGNASTADIIFHMIVFSFLIFSFPCTTSFRFENIHLCGHQLMTIPSDTWIITPFYVS